MPARFIPTREATPFNPEAEDADVVIVVMEAKTIDIKGFLAGIINQNLIIVINKCDLAKSSLDKEIKKYNPIEISITKEINIDLLIEEIKNKIKKKFISTEDILITRERHRENLEACFLHLQNFDKQNNLGDFDKAAEDLRLATRQLGMIVGKVDVEEILGSIFNDFCIGK